MLMVVWLGGSPPGEGLPIVGGEPVAPGHWPAVVGVNTKMICTGTLVAPDLVLTAAHCFEPAPSQAVRVSFGDDLFTAEVVLSDDWARHPDYCPPSECGVDLRDFAWIRLPTPVSVEPIVPLRTQAELDASMSIGAPLWLVGFGRDDVGVAGIKREVLASLLELGESGREFRAGGAGKDTCSGDSGGPALVELGGQWRLAGVTSRGFECGQGGIYGVPLAELCWLRDSSGVDLLPRGCERCDCVVFDEEAEPGCNCAAATPRLQGWWLVLLFGVVWRPSSGWGRRNSTGHRKLSGKARSIWIG